MRLATYSQSGPSVGDNLDRGGMDVLVFLNEMGSNDCSEKLGRRDRVLFGHDIDGVLHGVCRYDNAVVCFCVSWPSQLGVIYDMSRYLRGLDVSFEEHTYCHLYHSLDPRACILMDFVDPDVIFAILGCGNMRHDCSLEGVYEREIRNVLEYWGLEKRWKLRFPTGIFPLSRLTTGKLLDICGTGSMELAGAEGCSTASSEDRGSENSTEWSYQLIKWL